MAAVKFNIQMDMRTFAGFDYTSRSISGGGASGSPTHYDIFYNSGFYELVDGVGMSGFGAGSFPASGTVTAWEFGVAEVFFDPLNPYTAIHHAYSLWKFSGMSVPAADIANATTSDGATLAAYMPTILAGNDDVQGSAYGDYLFGYDGNDLIYGFGGNDILEGGIGADTIDGGSGVDQMYGAAGDDIYIVDDSADLAVESASQGIDLVKSSASFALLANVERLQLTGSAAINATGNSLNNVLNGNSGNNVLDGNGGADAMGGGLGDDTYVVDNAGDAVNENASAGIDLVKSSISYTLGNNLERLQLIGSAIIDGTGNGLNNVINGNSVANILDGKGGGDTIGGAGGDDTINGGLGNDQLSGGAGADSFVYDTSIAGYLDRISDFTAVDDTIVLDQSIFMGVTSTGVLSAAAFHTGTSAHDADDRIIYDNATGRIWYDADGNGAGAATLFIQLGMGTALSNVDFLVVA